MRPGVAARRRCRRRSPSTRPAAASRLWAWKAPTSGSRNHAAAQQLHLQPLPIRRGGLVHQPQRTRPPAIVQDLEPAIDGETGQIRELRHVGVQDGRRSRRQQFGEQPALRHVIGRRAAMVVEVVPADVGEGGCGQAQPIDPMLVEAVAGRLDDQILGAGARQLGRQPVKRDRVRRGQAALARCVRGLQSQRAQARRRVRRGRPRLPGERRDRGLAAGAGDRRHGARLPAKKRAATRASAARGSAAIRAGTGIAAVTPASPSTATAPDASASAR